MYHACATCIFKLHRDLLVSSAAKKVKYLATSLRLQTKTIIREKIYFFQQAQTQLINQ